MLKKTTLAILGLAASGIASAGTMGPTCVPGDVTVPCEVRQWDLGVQALYLQSVFDANYGYDNAAGNTHKEIDQPWDWGFRLEGSYHFSTGNDVTMTWMHYDADHSQAGFVGAVPIILPPPLPSFSANNIPFVLKTENKFDQVNLVFGQHVDVGMLKNIRFYGGFQYADIRVDANNVYQLPASVPAPPPFGSFPIAFSASQYHNTDFNGVGVVAGLDYAYEVTQGLSITANSAMSLLYGTGRYSDGYIISNVVVAVSNYARKKMMVPSLEAKLGANYAHPMAAGVLNIEAGYQVVNYFNALQTRGPGAAGAITNSDYGLYGPYLGVKWVGHA